MAVLMCASKEKFVDPCIEIINSKQHVYTQSLIIALLRGCKTISTLIGFCINLVV